MFLRILGQHFHFNFHPIQAILRQISVFIKCSKHLQCFCVEIPRRINFDNQKIFFRYFFQKQPGFLLKASQNNQLPLFALKAGYRTIQWRQIYCLANETTINRVLLIGFFQEFHRKILDFCIFYFSK